MVPEQSAPRSPGSANGHAVKPRCNAIPLLDLAGVPRECQKCALEGIFDVGLSAED
jgi:hypothetical protein